MRAPVVMIQGTASSVGKSIVTTGLCRLFRNEGYRVAPFKAQNMALNSYVTPDGGEIGRAQAVQAEAAGCIATVDMNPVLLKPEGNATSQVVVHGKPVGTMSAWDYHETKPRLRALIADSLERLRAEYDVVVIEGAGSPAEINLKAHDIVNMDVALRAEAPVLLVGDIDRGGVFAAIVGTMELLPLNERRLIAGFVINKFRGDPNILRPGLDMLVERTGVPVLGVLPYLRGLRVPEEDSVSLDDRPVRAGPGDTAIDIAVVRLPRIANHDDFAPLEHETGVVVRFVERPDDAADPDLLVLPGSKCTATDLQWLRSSGWDRVILGRAARRARVLGICGGYQMLGLSVEDPHHIESDQSHVEGLGLLDVRTRFADTKVTAQVQARANEACFLTHGLDATCRLEGYEIHMGRCEVTGARPGPFRLQSRNGQAVDVLDGAVSADGAVVGTLLHGVFENQAVRACLLNALRAGKAPGPTEASPVGSGIATREEAYEQVAAMLREHLDLAALRDAMGLTAARREHSA